MKQVKKFNIIGLALVLALVAGCNKPEVQSSGAEAAPNQSAPKQMQEEKAVQKPAPDLAAYYAANLDEAQAERKKCLQLAEADITPEVFEKCSAAQAAWENRAYKPKSK